MRNGKRTRQALPAEGSADRKGTRKSRHGRNRGASAIGPRGPQALPVLLRFLRAKFAHPQPSIEFLIRERIFHCQSALSHEPAPAGMGLLLTEELRLLGLVFCFRNGPCIPGFLQVD